MFIFYVSASVGDAELGNLPIFKEISSEISEIKLKSKSFDSYKECIEHAQRFITDVAESLNSEDGSFFIQTGFNPEFGENGEEPHDPGVPGIGQLGRWNDNELCRFYLINSKRKENSGVFLTKLIVSILTQQTTTKGN